MPFQPRANPLAAGPLRTKGDVQRAARDLIEPLSHHTSRRGANVRLGSFSAVFADRVAELEGFARPLYGIVPLVVGGGEFGHWDRIASGLDAGSDPASPEFWGPVSRDIDQRMVEQAGIGLALAFCPETTWDALDRGAQVRLADWLRGIFTHEPAPNNWQLFRVLVALGLERVGVPFERTLVDKSLDLVDSYRSSDHWYRDGDVGAVDYYVPWAFHTYGLMYVAANRLGLGDDKRAAAFAERAAGFAGDFVHWFGPDGAAIPYGRSLTYRFAAASMWGALAWADVESAVPWPVVKGMSMRHLRWWADKPISDRDGVISVGYAYDNRRLGESYNSPGSPYWCMKFFAGLGAPDDHPFWATDEEQQPLLDEPVTLRDAGWVVDRDEEQAVALIAPTSPTRPWVDQAAAKYHKLAYSSAFGFSGDFAAADGSQSTDSTLTLTDGAGARAVSSVALAGTEDGFAWRVSLPFPDVRVNTVLVGGVPWHLRLHLIENARPLLAEESGFAVGFEPDTTGDPGSRADPWSTAEVREAGGVSIVTDLHDVRTGDVRDLPVNANIMRSHARVPVLTGRLERGVHRLATAVYAAPRSDADVPVAPAVPDAAAALLERISTMDVPT